ncbi:hypothetical protein RFI_17303, partial [Reticulomyxa filosa]
MERTRPVRAREVPKLARPDYYCLPSIKELEAMTEEQLRAIKNLTVGHKVYGKVMFPGETDVRGIDLDEVVTIGWRAIQVYVDDDPKKPAIGKGLNKKAEVELHGVTPLPPKDASEEWRPTRAEMEAFALQLETNTRHDEDVTWIGLDVDTYVWRFAVRHWTIYGFSEGKQTTKLEGMPTRALVAAAATSTATATAT